MARLFSQNRAAERLFGYDARELVGARICPIPAGAGGAGKAYPRLVYAWRAYRAL